MKYLKLFETRRIDPDFIKGLEHFYNEYTNDSKRGYLTNNFAYRAKLYNVPEEFNSECFLLDYYYNHTSKYKYYSKEVMNYIKKSVKKDAIESIHDKCNKEPELYYKLKNVLDKRKIESINDGAMKNIFFLFQGAIRKMPEIIKAVNKYNL